MKTLPLLIASAAPSDLDLLKDGAKPGNPDIYGADITVVLAIALGLAAILFFWVFFIRAKPTHARGSLVVSRKRKRGDKEPAEVDTTVRRRKRRRGDHPDNWSRNPTLSETGGLPPPRPEEPDSPSTPSRQ